MSYVPFGFLTGALYDKCATKVDALCSNLNTNEYGLHSVGLKLHDLTGGEIVMPLVDRLGGREATLEINHYRRANGAACLVLPPVGSAEAAILLVECIEIYLGVPLFRNPKIQIQACNPGRLPNLDAALLTLGFYFGSDVIRQHNLADFETTFTENSHIPRGKRITLYDGRGQLDRDFEWWRRGTTGTLDVLAELPFSRDRTDVLACTTRKDIRNINLLQTLLMHANMGSGYWGELGEQLRKDFIALLRKHHLGGILHAQWIIKDHAQGQQDQGYASALREIRACAVEEVKRVYRTGSKDSILHHVNDLLETYRSRLIRQALAIQGGVA